MLQQKEKQKAGGGTVTLLGRPCHRAPDYRIRMRLDALILCILCPSAAAWVGYLVYALVKKVVFR